MKRTTGHSHSPPKKTDNAPGTSRRPLLLFREAAVQLLSSQIPILSREHIDRLLEIPPEEKGDLAFPCFALSKELRKAPALIARELKIGCERELAKMPPRKRFFKVVSQDGPYLNFVINHQLLSSLLRKSVAKLGHEFGSHGKVETRVIIEHTSANPNGPFHVGRARNPIIGDTMARILESCGYDVVTEYYVNDMGKQAMILKWGVEHLELAKAKEYLKELEQVKERTGEESEGAALTILPDKPDYPHGVLYRKATQEMERDDEVRGVIEHDMLELEMGARVIGEEAKAICGRVLEGLLMSLENLNIHLDNFAYESDYVFDGSVNSVIENLKRSKLLVEEDGAFGLELEGIVHGRNTKFFFTRKGGTSLYTTRDLAYHLDKLGRCDVAINVLGEDHKLQSIMLKTALEELAKLEGWGPRTPEVMFYSFVTLKEGKMSTRKGRVVYFDDLVNEGVHRAQEEVRERRPELPEDEVLRIGSVIGKGAVRFNIIKVQPEKHIKFSWKDALNIEGESAPFIMYSTVRCESILRKGNFEDAYLDREHTCEHEIEQKLLKQLALFPELVLEAGEKRSPHLIAVFALKTASIFNMFYRDCQVIGSGDAEKGRLGLVYMTKLVLGKAMELLGIEIPEKM